MPEVHVFVEPRPTVGQLVDLILLEGYLVRRSITSSIEVVAGLLHTMFQTSFDFGDEARWRWSIPRYHFRAFADQVP